MSADDMPFRLGAVDPRDSVSTQAVATVVVTYNGAGLIRACLDSVLAEVSPESIFVVDNDSTDDTGVIVKRAHEKINLICLEENVGFGAANNIGIRYALDAGFDGVFLLNQDALVSPGCLESLCDVAALDPEYGVLSPVHYGHGFDHLDSSFRSFVWRSGMFDDALYSNLRDVYSVPFVNAAAWLITQECLKKVGGFSPNFFVYGEDEDYCSRVLYHGLKVGVVPKSRIRHLRAGNELSSAERFSFSVRRRRGVQTLMCRLLDPFEVLWRTAFCVLVDIVASFLCGVVSHTARVAVADFCAWCLCMFRLKNLLYVRRMNMQKQRYLWLHEQEEN